MSLLTADSIVEEHADPIPPAIPPYQRKKLKLYKAQPNGKYRGQTILEPFDFDKETLKLISNAVWKKLKLDAEINQQVEEDLKREMKI